MTLLLAKSVGTAMHDVLAAKAIYDTPCEHGLGRRVDLLIEKAF
jgi:ornithine cyclodeaminase/alanine dehydrogenase-like protein (mu-crystallin family)